MKRFYVYIACSKRNGTLYVGVTSNLDRRMYEHKHKLLPGFTAKYSITSLVYYETYEFVTQAIKRERCIKAWKRSWKLELIEKINPQWKDLSEEEL